MLTKIFYLFYNKNTKAWKQWYNVLELLLFLFQDFIIYLKSEIKLNLSLSIIYLCSFICNIVNICINIITWSITSLKCVIKKYQFQITHILKFKLWLVQQVNRALTKDLQASNIEGNMVSTTRLGLTLRLERHHFSEGKLTVVCQSALPGIANNLVSESMEIATLAASNQRLAQEPPKSGVSRSNAGMFYTVLIFWIVVPIHIIRYYSLRFLRV